MLRTRMSLELLSHDAADAAIDIVDIVPYASPLLDRLGQEQIEQLYGTLCHLNDFNPFNHTGENVSEATLLSLSDRLYQEYLGDEYGGSSEVIGRMIELMSREPTLNNEERQEFERITAVANVVHREIMRHRYSGDCKSFCQGIYGWQAVFFQNFDEAISTYIDLKASGDDIRPDELTECEALEFRYMMYLDAVAGSLVSLYEEFLTTMGVGVRESVFDSIQNNGLAIQTVGRFLLYHFLH